MAYPVNTHLKCTPGNVTGGVAPLSTYFQWELGGIAINGATASDYIPLTAGVLTCNQIVIDSTYDSISAETVSVTIDAAVSFLSAAININQLTITLSNSATVSDSTGFTLSGNSMGGSVSAIYVSGSNPLLFTSTLSAIEGETILLNYTSVTDGIEDSAGNDLPSIVNGIVTNNTVNIGLTSLNVIETFDGTGYDLNWIERNISAASPDYATAPAPLAGSQSLSIPGNASNDTERIALDLGAEYTELWGKFENYVEAATSDPGSGYVLIGYNSNGSVGNWSSSDGEMSMYRQGGGFKRLLGSHGLDNPTSSLKDTAIDSYQANIKHYIWWHYKAETSEGSNDGIFELCISDTNSKPAYITATDGPRVRGIQFLMLKNPSDNVTRDIYDNFQVSETPIDP